VSQTQVQAVSGTSTAAATSVSATLSAATAGNILWCAVGMDKSSGTLTPPSGFTTLVAQDSASVSTYVGYKIAAGGETTITLTRATASTAGDTMWVGEYSDTNTVGTWQVLGSASDLTNETTRLVTPSGTTAATRQQGQAIAWFTIDSGQSNTGTLTYTNSYTNIRTYAASGKGDVAVAVLADVAAGTSATSSQTHTPTADQTSGVIAVFAKVGQPLPDVPRLRRAFTLPRRKRNGAAQPLPAAAPAVTTQTLPPQPRRRIRPITWRPKAKGHVTQPPTGPKFNGSYPIPPQYAKPRIALRVPHRARGAQPPLSVQVVISAPIWIPTSESPRPPWRSRARARVAQPPTGPAFNGSYPAPPQNGPPRRPRWLPRAHPRRAEPVPAQVVVATVQVLPPQPARPARLRWAFRARPRQGQPVPAQVVIQTSQALPPQPGPRRNPFRARPHPRGTQIVITVTQPPPIQPTRRRLRPPLRTRRATAQRIPAQVITVQVLPPQSPRRWRPWPLRRRGHATDAVLITVGPPPSPPAGLIGNIGYVGEGPEVGAVTYQTPGQAGGGTGMTQGQDVGAVTYDPPRHMLGGIE